MGWVRLEWKKDSMVLEKNQHKSDYGEWIGLISGIFIAAVGVGGVRRDGVWL